MIYKLLFLTFFSLLISAFQAQKENLFPEKEFNFLKQIYPDQDKIEKYILCAQNNDDSARINYFQTLYPLVKNQCKIIDLLRFIKLELTFEEKSRHRSPERIAKLNAKIGYWAIKNGDPLTSIKYYRKAITLLADTNNKENVSYYYKYVALSLATNYAYLGDYNKAINLQKEGLTYFEKINSYRYIFGSYNNLGEYHSLQGNYMQSRKNYRKVIDYNREMMIDEQLANAFTGIGKIELIHRNYSLAESYLIKALDLITKAPKTRNSKELEIEIYTTLAEINLQDQQNVQNQYADMALALAEDYYGTARHRRLSHIFNIVGHSYIRINNFTKAKIFFRKAQKSLQKNALDLQQLAALNGLMQCHYNEYQKNGNEGEELMALVDSTIIIYEAIRQFYSSDAPRYQLANYIRENIEIGLNVCFSFYQNSNDVNYAEKILFYGEISKSAALFDELTKHNLDKETSENNSYLLLQSLLLENKENLNKAMMDEDSIKTHTYIDLERGLSKKIDEVLINRPDNLLNKEGSISPTFGSIAMILGNSHDAMIQYYQSKDYLYIIYFQNNEFNCERKLINDVMRLENLDSDYLKFLNSFKFHNRHSFDKESAKKVYQDLWPQSIKLAKNVLIIPDGSLAQIPFDALVDDEGNYLLESHNISYANSMRSLFVQEKIRNNKTFNEKVLCLSPIFENDKSRFLKQSQGEINSIVKSISTTSLLSEQASKTNFLNQASNYSVVHLSTHAGYSELDSNLTIEFINDKMSLNEIYNHKFNNALVTLSACETGIGEIHNNEGILSLSRAFAYSEVPTVVASLWSVNETSTSNIFGEFYSQLADNVSTSESLRLAKLNYLNNDKISAELKTPYYWAGLVHWGVDSEIPLEIRKSKSLYWILPFVLVIGFGFFVWLRKFKS